MNFARMLLVALLIASAGCGPASNPDVQVTHETSYSAPPPERLLWETLDLELVAKITPETRGLDAKLPKSVRELDGRRVQLRAFMCEAWSIENVRTFVVARKGDCLFGRDAVWHFVDVRLRTGETTTFRQREPIRLEGTFRVEVDESGTEVLGLYRLEDARVL